MKVMSHYVIVRSCDSPSIGVYTKNRNFRLPLSSKLGKNVPLLPAKGSLFKVISVCVYVCEPNSLFYIFLAHELYMHLTHSTAVVVTSLLLITFKPDSR